MEEQEFEFNKPREFNEIFYDSLLFLKQFKSQYFLYVLLFAGPFLVIGAYYSSVAQLIIVKTENILSAQELWYAFFFDFLADIIINGVTFGFIISYIHKKDVSRQAISEFFNKNILIIIGATVFSNVLMYFGLLLLILPGIILSAPLSLYVYDKFLHQEPYDITFTRCLRMSQAEYKLAYGIILLMFIVIFVIKQLAGGIIPIESTNFIAINIIVNVSISVLFSAFSVVVALLYYSIIQRNLNTSI